MFRYADYSVDYFHNETMLFRNESEGVAMLKIICYNSATEREECMRLLLVGKAVAYGDNRY